MLNEDEEIENDEGEAYFDDDDDGLGYYPDGVKRTLTDEQIAMFRHSEIYSLFRKQQVQDEACDANENQNDACDLDESMISGPLDVASISNSAFEIGKELDISHGDDNEDEEYLKFLEAEGKQMEADQKQLEAERKMKKRKFGHVNGSKSHDRAPTHRRIARELDDAITSHDVLNYDEENAETLDPPEKPSHHDGQEKVFKFKGLISEPSTTVQTLSANIPYDPPKGRKIWWPIIGQTVETLP